MLGEINSGGDRAQQSTLAGDMIIVYKVCCTLSDILPNAFCIDTAQFYTEDRPQRQYFEVFMTQLEQNALSVLVCSLKPHCISNGVQH